MCCHARYWASVRSMVDWKLWKIFFSLCTCFINHTWSKWNEKRTNETWKNWLHECKKEEWNCVIDEKLCYFPTTILAHFWIILFLTECAAGCARLKKYQISNTASTTTGCGGIESTKGKIATCARCRNLSIYDLHIVDVQCSVLSSRYCYVTVDASHLCLLFIIAPLSLTSWSVGVA